MRVLKQWPGSWIAAAWVLWPALLFVLGAAAVAMVVGGLRVRSESVSAYVTVHVQPSRIPALVVVLFAPPALLTGVWLGQRRGGHEPPPA